MQVACAAIGTGTETSGGRYRELQVLPQLSTLNSPPTGSVQQARSSLGTVAAFSLGTRSGGAQQVPSPERQHSACPPASGNRGCSMHQGKGMRPEAPLRCWATLASEVWPCSLPLVQKQVSEDAMKTPEVVLDSSLQGA